MKKVILNIVCFIGWKNLTMFGALGVAIMFINPQTANAQNPIVDDLGESNETVGEKYETLMLDPNKTIKENYAKIDSLMSLHKENQYAKYIIMPIGHYINKQNESYDFPIGMIQLKGKNNEKHKTVSDQIIEALTRLYANSLDERFPISSDQYHSMNVNEKEYDVETGRSYKHQNGDVLTEYMKKKFGGNTFYSLYETSQLYKKIYNKVVEETCLKDGGIMYELEQQTEKMDKQKIDMVDKKNSEKENIPHKKKRRESDDDLYF